MLCWWPLFSQDASIVMPNNGDISLGDIDYDGQVDLTDGWLIAVYLNDPSDPALRSGIGEPVGPAASLSPDPSTVTFARRRSLANGSRSRPPGPW